MCKYKQRGTTPKEGKNRKVQKNMVLWERNEENILPLELQGK